MAFFEREQSYLLAKLLRVKMTHGFREYFEKKVAVRRIRLQKHQGIETLINEEAFLFAKFLRDEKPTWKPRIVGISQGIPS
jgi:hypothetical protein